MHIIRALPGTTVTVSQYMHLLYINIEVKRSHFRDRVVLRIRHQSGRGYNSCLTLILLPGATAVIRTDHTQKATRYQVYISIFTIHPYLVLITVSLRDESTNGDCVS